MNAKPIERLFDFFYQHIQEITACYNHQLSKSGQLYLSNLLVQHVEEPVEKYPDTLAELHILAMQHKPAMATQLYRDMGDRALFVSVFIICIKYLIYIALSEE